MNFKPIFWIALALAIALGIAVCDGLRIRDKASVVAGRYQEAAAIAEANEKSLTTQIAKVTEIVGQKDKEIAEKIETIGRMTNDIGRKDKELDKIRGTWSKLSADCQARLHELDVTWTQKFSLSEAIIAEKDKVISAWAAKFDAQIIISESWKAKYNSELHLRTISEQGWKLANRKLKIQGIIGDIKTGAIITTAGYIIFNAIKGK
ncbi:MAG: hypothetical protein NTV06_00550 [candidate division Zixibacteria bacterium]|nr:hypothetical protein [candidate division Zixibacteria bacterium]